MGTLQGFIAWFVSLTSTMEGTSDAVTAAGLGMCASLSRNLSVKGY